MTEEPISLEILVEEPSAKRALEVLVPKIVPGTRFEIFEFRGKDALLKDLPRRLAGYAARLSWESIRVAVLVDRDDDDCVVLKERLQVMAKTAGLVTTSATSDGFTILNRIVVEELEAWFFGDVPALCAAYPRIPSTLHMQQRYRDPDAVAGGTCEALGRVLARHGYHKPRLQKLLLASDIAPHMDVENNRSQSFQVFRDGLRRLVSEES